MKTYVLYDADADGFGSAFAAFLKLGESAVYIPVRRGEPPPPMPEANQVYILDFNYPREVMIDMSNDFVSHLGGEDRVCLIDHHATAQVELGDLPYCHFDTSKSAAVLSWEYFHPDQDVPAFFGYIQDSDLWTWGLPLSREVHLAVESYPMDFATWSTISGIAIPRTPAIEAMCLEQLMDDGSICRRFVQQQVREALADSRMASFVVNGTRCITFDPDAVTSGDGVYRVPVVNATNLSSEICNELLIQNPDSPFAASYRDLNDGRRQWSLRSRDDFDCSQVASAFGGGGHPKASGFATFHDSDYGFPAKPTEGTAQ